MATKERQTEATAANPISAMLFSSPISSPYCNGITTGALKLTTFTSETMTKMLTEASIMIILPVLSKHLSPLSSSTQTVTTKVAIPAAAKLVWLYAHKLHGSSLIHISSLIVVIKP